MSGEGSEGSGDDNFDEGIDEDREE